MRNVTAALYFGGIHKSNNRNHVSWWKRNILDCIKVIAQWCSGRKKALNDFPEVLMGIYGTTKRVHLLGFVHSSSAYLIMK